MVGQSKGIYPGRCELGCQLFIEVVLALVLLDFLDEPGHFYVEKNALHWPVCVKQSL